MGLGRPRLFTSRSAPRALATAPDAEVSVACGRRQDCTPSCGRGQVCSAAAVGGVAHPFGENNRLGRRTRRGRHDATRARVRAPGPTQCLLTKTVRQRCAARRRHALLRAPTQPRRPRAGAEGLGRSSPIASQINGGGCPPPGGRSRVLWYPRANFVIQPPSSGPSCVRDCSRWKVPEHPVWQTRSGRPPRRPARTVSSWRSPCHDLGHLCRAGPEGHFGP